MKIQYLCLLLLLFSVACRSNPKIDQKKDRAFITVKFNGVPVPDSLSLYLMRYTLTDEIGHNFIPPTVIISRKQSGGIFNFEIAGISRLSYFCLNKGEFNPYDVLLENYLVEPNDSIIIEIAHAADSFRFDKGLSLRMYLRRHSNLSFSFYGRGAAKNRARYQVDSMLMSHSGNLSVIPVNSDTSNYFSLVFPKGLEIIEKYKQSISNLSYEVLKADLVGLLNSFRYKSIYSTILSMPHENQDSIAKRIGFWKNDFLNTTRFLNSNEAKAISFYYPISILYFDIDLLAIKGYRRFSLYGKEAFSLLCNNYKGELRDKLLTYFIINYYSVMPNRVSILNKALIYISNRYYRDYLSDFRNSHSIGALICGIPLKDQNGVPVRLTKFRGKVMFLDFWFTGCTFCKRYYQNSLSKVEAAFVDNTDVVFVSISTDKQKDMWLNSIKEDLYSTDSLPNVINLYTGGKGGNHPLIEFYKISGYPTLMLFDKSGKLFNLSTKELRVDSAGVARQINLALER